MVGADGVYAGVVLAAIVPVMGAAIVEVLIVMNGVVVVPVVAMVDVVVPTDVCCGRVAMVLVACVSDTAAGALAPPTISILIAASVFGPTVPIASIPCCVCSFRTAASVFEQ